MSHESHTNAICKSIFLQLDKISRVCPLLSVCATEKLMSAFVLSQWDYCSSLFVHLPNRQLYKPQRAWNNVAWADQTMNPFCTCSHWLEDEHTVLLLSLPPVYLISASGIFLPESPHIRREKFGRWSSTSLEPPFGVLCPLLVETCLRSKPQDQPLHEISFIINQTLERKQTFQCCSRNYLTKKQTKTKKKKHMSRNSSCVARSQTHDTRFSSTALPVWIRWRHSTTKHGGKKIFGYGWLVKSIVQRHLICFYLVRMKTKTFRFLPLASCWLELHPLTLPPSFNYFLRLWKRDKISWSWQVNHNK